MTPTAVTVLLALATATPVEVSTIEGTRHTGTIVSADLTTWKLESKGETVDVALSSILEARLPSKGEAAASSPHEIILVDGSRMGSGSIQLSGETVTMTAAAADSITLPRSSIGNIRFAESPSSVDTQWTELLSRERREDWLVIRKEEKLDFVPGVVSSINDQHVSLLLDGETVPVARANVFGVILRHRGTGSTKAAGLVELRNGDRLAVHTVTSNGTEFTLQLAVGPRVTIPITSVRLIDFSSDKLTWLSSLKPRDIKHEFRFIEPATPLQNDRDVWGEALRLGNQSFTRGICLRSKTIVQYRLNGDHSRFLALMGIQHGYAGDVYVEISADGQKLLAESVSPLDKEPFNVELDVSGKFQLEILVDYGTVQSDIGDHLVLAEARLLK
ncbi:MAG: NPCBM/NEW2 domain-containing protein [Planctomycetota bacterium]|nr:NPCBM/NEW2 domain-containing protein [Planctomycetota bacterium]